MERSKSIMKRKKVPNTETVKAMKALDQGKGKRFKSARALFRDRRI